MLRKYYDMKEAITNIKTSTVHKKITESKNQKILKTIKKRIVLSSKCTVCDSKT